MAIEKASEPRVPGEDDDEPIEVEIQGEEPEEEQEDEPVEFTDNLACHMEDTVLNSLASEWIGDFEADERSRAPWYKTIEQNMDLLGLKFDDRTVPWPGACGVYHPLIPETLVRFGAQAIMEIFPSAGPARTEVIGKMTPEKMKLAQRVEDEMNFILTEKMPEYREETEQLLFWLGLCGSAFRKIYFDPVYCRPMAITVPAADFVVAYGTTDLKCCQRATHKMKKTKNEVRRLQVNGFYRDIEIPEPSPNIGDSLSKKIDKLKGETPSIEVDERHTLLEMVVYCDLPGFEDPDGLELPYVVTIEKDSKIVLSIYRNWKEGDPHQLPRQYYVRWLYLPGPGFYGIGLIHLIGGIAKATTSMVRQLVDAGTLANLPGGLKGRGLRIKGDDTPIMPGEWRDVDLLGGAIKDNIFPMPYKEPSKVLLDLMNGLVQEGRRIGSVADTKFADMNQQAPVGTTLALLEREMKVMSSVQARLHQALKEEFKLISAIVRDDMDDKYETHAEEPNMSRKADFGARVLVMPVSDPNASTTGQKILSYQAGLQMMQASPLNFDQPAMFKQALAVYGFKDVDTIVKSPEDIQPMDPVSENMAILTGKPVKAFQYQDHDSHIQVHMAAAQDPKIMQMIGQSPQAQMIAGAASAHVTEHLAMKYRQEIEKQLGVPLPTQGEPLPPDVENRLSSLVAQAAQKLFQKDKQEVAQQQAQQQMQDPVIQMQKQELQIKQQDAQRKAEEARQKHQLDMAKLSQQAQLERARLSSQERIAGTNVGAKSAEALMRSKAEEKKSQAERHARGVEIGVDIAKHQSQQKHETKKQQADIELKHKELEADKAQAEAAAKEKSNGSAGKVEE